MKYYPRLPRGASVLVWLIVSSFWTQAFAQTPATSPATQATTTSPGPTEYDRQIDELETKIARLRDASRLQQAAQTPPVVLTRRQRDICKQLGLDPKKIARLEAKPLYRFNEREVDLYIRYLHASVPDLRQRVAHLARKNLGQPYELYLLGEMPFEHHDPQPIYSLGRSDCLVFCEHTYAMALTDSWPTFMKMLQRIRYKDGQIGVATRNHYTEADWNPNNRWLVRDITAELAGNKTVRFSQKVDRAKFLRKRYQLQTDFPIQEYEHVFIRYEDIDLAKPHLRDGDFVNIVRGTPPKPGDANRTRRNRPRPGSMKDIFGGNAWVGHTGMIVMGDDGEVHLIHSTSPQVREEPLDDYIARATENNARRDAAGKARLLGFKFLRLENDSWKNLRKLDGQNAPQVTLPGGEPASFR